LIRREAKLKIPLNKFVGVKKASDQNPEGKYEAEKIWAISQKPPGVRDFSAMMKSAARSRFFPAAPRITRADWRTRVGKLVIAEGLGPAVDCRR